MRQEQNAIEYGRLSNSLVFISAALIGCVLSLMCFLVVRSHFLYLIDAGYIMQQISMHAEYGRKLYEQIEFPYGPFLFYGPIVLAALLSPLHISSTAVYYLALVIEHVTGLLLAAYILDRLPMLRKWKTLLFLLCAVATFPMNLGLNYTLLRFVLSPACLIFACRKTQPWTVAMCFFLGQMISLSVSPEMALAFGAASVAYATFLCYTKGWAWVIAASAPLVATFVFFLLINRNYLLMLKSFALGAFNFIVEPLPHILIFLFALVWLVPCGLAFFFRQRRPDAPMVAALYIFSLALLPVAFGRADPGHVLFDGLMIFFLSMGAISALGRRQQGAWAILVTAFFLWSTYVNVLGSKFEWKPALSEGVLGYQATGMRNAALTFIRTGSLTQAEQMIVHIPPDDHSFDIGQLTAIIGRSPVVVPFTLPLYAEEEIKAAGLLTPSYYCSLIGVLDAGGEQREIDEFNTSQWALLPEKLIARWTETPDNTKFAMGIQLTYPEKHPPYIIGERFNENLAVHWQPVSKIGIYEVYRRR